MAYRFRPKIAPTLAALALFPILLQLGWWQWHKADARQALQQRIDTQGEAAPLFIDGRPLPAGLPRQRHVRVRGHYESGFQFLLDNQMHGDQPGYYVMTPLRIEGSALRVLVNRGWVPLGRSRDVLPPIAPPGEAVEVTGTVWAPPRQMVLAAETAGAAWQPVWQSIDLAHYRTLVPFALQPFMIRLDPAAAGCYICDWPRPGEKAPMHRGYALQWFGMAGVLVGFYLFASVERKVLHDKEIEPQRRRGAEETIT